MRKLSKILMLVIFLVLLSLSVSGIGVSPAKRNIDFESNSQITTTFNIVNNENKEFTAVIYARGELSEYIKIQNPVINFKSDEKRKKVTVQLEPLESIGNPGAHQTEIVVIEYPAKFNLQEDSPAIQARGSVVAKLNFLVPFPGKYAEANLHVSSAAPNENVVFNIPIFNYGKENIMSAHAVIRVLGSTYEKIAEFESNKIQINSQGQGKLTAAWLANVNPGTYHVIAEVYYDNNKIVLEKDFKVGTLLVDIEKIETGDFTLGDIARFDITLASKWNELIPNVYGDITITDKSGNNYGTYKTASVNIGPLQREIVTAFWDTRDVIIGIYDIKIAVHFSDQVTERLIEAEVNIDSIRTSFSPTGRVAGAPDSGNRNNMLVVLVIFLVLINIGWFIYFKRSKKNKK